MAIVTSTDLPKSVRNRCVFEVFGGVLMVSCCFFYFSEGVGAFVITESDLPPFSQSWYAHFFTIGRMS